MKDAYGVEESDVFRTLTIQETGGTKKAVAAGIDALKIMLPIANRAGARPCQPQS
jgi:altronate hydrolase